MEVRSTPPTGPTIDDIIAAFWIHAQAYYRGKDGTVSGELDNLKYDLRLLRRLYGSTQAGAFEPICLKACRAEMIRKGLSRKSINRRTNRIRYVFKWAASEEMIAGSVVENLKTVTGLKKGRTDARETPKIKAVSEPHVQAVMQYANRHVAAMMELQMVTGMRSGEMVIMRTGDIDRTGKVWTYTPTKHKTEHLDHERIIHFGKRAQEIVTPFLKLDPAAYIFSPIDAEAERLAARAHARKTPLSCGNRPGSNRQRNPRKQPGERYDVKSFRQAVSSACNKAFPVPAEITDRVAVNAWKKKNHINPHQLRHTAGTKVRREYGLDAVQAVLGQKTMQSAEVYAEVNMEKARDVMGSIG